MQILIPRTGKVSMALYTIVFIFLFFPNLHAEKHPFPFSKIVFHCVDWVTDTLPSYDLDFVHNNPRCIGNPTVFASPKTAAESPQVLPSASWGSRVGAGLCNLEPTVVNLDSIRNLGFVYASVEGVEGGPKPDLSWRDEVVYYSCTEMQQNGGIYARILRKWTASYQNLQKDTIQEILFVQPSLAEFVFGENAGGIIPDGFDQIITYQACSGDKGLIQKGAVTPFVQSYFNTNLKPRLAFIDEANGRYGVKVQDTDFLVCGGPGQNRGLKILRSMFVFDSCQGQYVDTFSLIIKIGDYQGPKFIKTKELPEIHVNSSDGKAVFGLNRSEFAARFGVIIEECLLGNISARFKVKDRYVGGVLVAENVWDDVPNATPSIYNQASVPPGHYKIYCDASDGCYNYSQDSFEFLVKNEIGPLPICVNRMSVESLLPDGQGGGTFTLKATDFVGGPIYDPNGQGPDTLGGKKLITHYSINRIGQAVDSSQKELKFTCFDANKLILVELHAWDKNGRDGFCTTFVEVQNRNMVCFDQFAFRFSGQVSTEGHVGVQNVNMDLNDFHGDYKNTKTLNSGTYTFANLNRDQSYLLTPKLDENPLDGVSTFDILLIQRHILGIQVLNSPYKMIAADVNNSRSITSLDMIQLRKLILGIDTKLINNRSWRFVDAAYVFPDPTNPWRPAFPESSSIASWRPNPSTNFVAIKIGDMNASAKVNTSE